MTTQMNACHCQRIESVCDIASNLGCTPVLCDLGTALALAPTLEANIPSWRISVAGAKFSKKTPSAAICCCATKKVAGKRQSSQALPLQCKAVMQISQLTRMMRAHVGGNTSVCRKMFS